jgi:nucleoid DNA-binding protein
MAKTAKTPEKKAPAAKPAAKKVAYPEKYTAAAMIKYIAEKNSLTTKEAKAVYEDVFDVIVEGLFSGARIPLGKFGKIYIAEKPAQKARMGRNPFTGEAVKIAAKKATKVPRMKFAKTFKEEVVARKIKK